MRKYAIDSSRIRNSFPITLKRFYAAILTNRYLFHNLLVLGTNILTGIFAYLLHPLLGQLMGIEEYGQVAALISFSLVLTTPTQIISIIAAKYASSSSAGENHAQLNGLIRRLTAILLAVGVGITIVFTVTSRYMAIFFHLDSQQGVILLGLTFVVSLVTPLNLGMLQGLQRFGWFATITLLSSFLRLVLAICFVLLGFGVNGAILGIVVSVLLTYLISFQPLRDILTGPRIFSGSLQSLWSYAILTGAASAGIVALYSIDTVLARHFLNASEAGLYAALATIGKIVLYITSSVSLVMFPRVAALHEQRKPQTRVVLQAVLGVLILSGAVEAAFYIAPLFITEHLFGLAFLAIAGQLAPYGTAMLLFAVAGVLMNYFLAIGNRPFVLIIFLACVLQTGLIAWHHADITQFVQAMIITNTILVLTLLCVFGLRVRWPRTALPQDVPD